jgi:hypothetical protein
MLRRSSDLSLTRLTGYNSRKINRTELTNMPGSAHNELWPELPYEAWKDTRDTLHLFRDRDDHEARKVARRRRYRRSE